MTRIDYNAGWIAKWAPVGSGIDFAPRQKRCLETLLDLWQGFAEGQVGGGTGIVMDGKLIAAKKGASLQMIAAQMHRPFKCNCTARIMQPSNEHLLQPPHPKSYSISPNSIEHNNVLRRYLDYMKCYCFFVLKNVMKNSKEISCKTLFS